MKHLFRLCFLSLIALSSANLFAQTAVMPAGGGSSVNPYKISSLENLYWVTQNPNTWGSNFRQTADIDASSTSAWNGGEGFTPIGNTTTPFTGTYFGNDGISSRKISNLYINRPASGFVGMFGYVTSEESISNLTLIDVNITGGDFVGGAIGAVAEGSDLRLLRLSVSGSVTGNGANVGGVVGRLESTDTDGLFYSTSHATVNGGSTVGGLVGYSTTIISKSSATGSVTGGLNTGGLVGYMNNDIEFSYASGAVNGSQFVGGFIGRTFGILTISDSYSTGTVTGTMDVGGFIGKVENSSSTIKSVVRGYASGDVNGSTNAGGFIGNNSISNATVENSYFNQTLSGQANAVGTGSSTGITSLSDIQFRQKESYSGWDFFSTWDIYESTSTPFFVIETYNPEKNLTQYPAPTLVSFDAGNGSSGSPYQISTAAQLNAIRGNLSAYYILTNNIDLTETTTWHNGKGFEPIGVIPRSSIANSIPFTGQFDGGGFIISNMYISRSSDRYIGFFGAASNAVLKNIALTDVNITGNTYTGSIVGNLYNPAALINNSYASGTVTGNGRVGGLAGEIAGGTAVNNYTSVNVSGGSGNGGFVGGMSAATISNNYAAGSVSGSSNIGGFYGIENIPKTLTNNYWNTETSGLEVGAGSGSTAGMTGLTTEQMRRKASFTGFDFSSTWNISEGFSFPFLQEFEYSALPGAADESVAGRALAFNTGQLSLNDNDAFDNANALTIEAWVFIKSDKRHGIVEKHVTGDNASGWWVDINTDITALFVSAGGSRAANSTVNPELNTWHHVAVTYDGTNVKIYLDGKDVSGTTSGSGSGTISNNTNQINAGRLSWTSLAFLDGSLDEVRIWKKARTLEQIRQDMYQKLKGDEEELILYLPMDDAFGTSVTDKSATSNTGTLDSGVSWTEDTHPYGTVMSGSEGWRIMSSPFGNVSYGEILDTLWTQGFSGSDSPDYGASNVLYYDEVSRQFTSILNADDVPSTGTGFIAYVYDDQDFDSNIDGFPKVIQVDKTQISGTVSPTLSFTDSGTLTADGWNLIGNPYGATINWDASAGWTTANLDATFYIWNAEDGEYQSWNGFAGTTALANGLIAPWQGFWVKANAADPEIIFTDEIRSAGGVFMKQKQVPKLRFTISNGEASNSAIVMFSENASLEKDNLDSYKLQSLSENYLSVFTKLEDGTVLDINALPYELEEAISIPLGFDGSELSGSFELSWSAEILPEGREFVLTDNTTGETFDLREQSSVIFELAPAQSSKVLETLEDSGRDKLAAPAHGIFTPKVMKATSGSANRFTLTITSNQVVTNERLADIPSEVELQQNYPNPFNPSTTIQYGVPETGEVTMEIFNMLGQKVATLINRETKQAGRYSVQFDADLASGLYLYRLKAGNTIITKKFTLIK